MSIKFVHSADLHLDSPVSGLSNLKRYNPQTVVQILSALVFLISVGLLISGYMVWGGVALAAALVLFLSRNKILRNTRMEIIQQDLNEAGESLDQELVKYERYLKDTVGLSAVPDPPHALEIMGRIERVKKLIRDEGKKLNERERKSERIKRFEERVVRLDPDKDSDKGLDGSEASAFPVYLPAGDARLFPG